MTRRVRFALAVGAAIVVIPVLAPQTLAFPYRAASGGDVDALFRVN